MSIALDDPTVESTTNRPDRPATQSPARPRRTLNRLALALGAVAAGAIGQYFFSQGSLWDGLLLYGIAVILFARALANHYGIVKTSDQLSEAGDELSEINHQLPNTDPHNKHPQPPNLPITNPATDTQAQGERLQPSNLPTFQPFDFAQDKHSNLPISNLHTGWRGRIGIWLMLLALGGSYLTYRFFGNEEARLLAWWFYFGGLFLFVGGALLLTKAENWRGEVQRLLPKTTIAIGLAVVLGIALFMRLYRFDSLPFGIWFDEAEAGLQARRMLAEPAYRPTFYPPINVTGHLLGLYAAALDWLGDSIQSMRLVSVAFGLAGMVVAYLFGRELRGPRFGLALAFLVAVARWHVNFSRIAMTGIDTPFFEFLSLFFLVRWLRQGRLRDALWAGLSLGGGLMFYTAFRLYVLALILFVIVAALIWWRRSLSLFHDKRWLAVAGHLVILFSVGWLVVLPLVQFANDQPEAFWYRTQQISIFTRRDQANVVQAVWETTRRHLLMFNFEGDENGRHNLPGEPMLDPAMAVLWVLGLGLAVRQLWSWRYRLRPAHLFFIILFCTSLIGGIFSVDFEAPQSLRSIAVIPAVLYFATVAVAAMGREAERALKPLPPAWVMAPAAILAGFVLISNASTYFIRQANDFASWNAFSTPETIVGREMAKLGPDYGYILSPFFSDHPSIRFLAPGAGAQEPLVLPGALPIRKPADRPVAIFIHPDDAGVFDEARRLYPNAEFEIANSQSLDKRPVVYQVRLQPADIASLQGLQLTYTRNDAADQPAGTPREAALAPLQSSRTMHVDVTWPQDSPIEADFVAEWRGLLHVPRYGAYKLRLVTPGAGLLELDDFTIFEGKGEQQTTLVLAQGDHSILLQAEGAPGQVALYWQPSGQAETLLPQWVLYAPPLANHGLQASFYSNDNWEGRPVLQRIDPYLDTYFHLPPLNRPYTVEWAGSLDVPQTGLYRLGLRAVQEAQLFVDNELLLTVPVPVQISLEPPEASTSTSFFELLVRWLAGMLGLEIREDTGLSSPFLTAASPLNHFSDVAATLEAGLHEIRVRFKDSTDRSRIHLYWTQPNGQFSPISGEYLWPPLGRPPESIAAQTPSTFEARPLELQWLASIGGFGNQPSQFSEPRDVAVLSNGNLVVADTANRRVQMLDSQGSFIQELSGDDLPFEEPLAVAVNNFDEILVLDASLQWVYRYDANGNLVDRFGGPEAHLFFPRGLTVFDDDIVALADTGGARVVFFNPDGSFRGQIGRFGDGPGQFIEPTDVLRDAQGTYLVAEAENDRIQQVDAGGNFLNQWAIPPTYALNGPHLTFGPDGSIFATESQSQTLLRYAPDGQLLHQWQTIGPVTLAAPIGIFFDETTSRLYVTDVQTHQVHVLVVTNDE